MQRTHLKIQITRSATDLNIPEHREALINWLNQWGCRQFALDYHKKASKRIFCWYDKYKEQLILEDKMLWELTKDDLKVISKMYDALAKKTASKKKRNNKYLNITIGPTGASKILFALRPNSMIPWDEPIRKMLKLNGDGNSYVEYLIRAKAEADSLFLSCKKNDVNPFDIPMIFGRHDASIAQLIGEYFWIVITRECCPPLYEIFECWAKWCKG
ncbi:MAG: hypothetical protein Q7S39_04845 [Ignavibacteria bacterium]|nr:hypothetical protein [Ignavibacteria bacterium]